MAVMGSMWPAQRQFVCLGRAKCLSYCCTSPEKGRWVGGGGDYHQHVNMTDRWADKAKKRKRKRKMLWGGNCNSLPPPPPPMMPRLYVAVTGSTCTSHSYFYENSLVMALKNWITSRCDSGFSSYYNGVWRVQSSKPTFPICLLVGMVVAYVQPIQKLEAHPHSQRWLFLH